MTIAERGAHPVALVLDPNFGDRLEPLARQIPV
jgi:hypothetical protein